MTNCKRYTVRAIGISLDSPSIFHTSTATNKNYTVEGCQNTPGKCGCIHAEINLLHKFPNPDIIYLTHSPCLACAKQIHAHGVRLVVFQEKYRIEDGINYLDKHGILTIYLPKE